MPPTLPANPAGTSQSWTSPLALQHAKFTRLQNNAGHLGFSSSPFFPKTAQEYGRHVAEYQGMLIAVQKERLARRLEEREVRRRVEGERRVIEEGRVGGDGEGEMEGGEGTKRDGALKDARVGKKMDGVHIEVLQLEDSEIESPADEGTPAKRKRVRSRRAARLKAKVKIDDGTTSVCKEDVSLTPSVTPASKNSSAVRATVSLSGNIPNVSLSSTAKLHATLSKTHTSSPLYHTPSPVPSIFTAGQKEGHTPVLAEKSAIWSGSEALLPPGRRALHTLPHRSAWPDLSELKSYGQYRLSAGRPRRLPLPRLDIMTREAVIREAGGIEHVKGMSQKEKDRVARKLEQRTGEEIFWGDREPVRFWGFDRLECVSRERREEGERRRRGEGVFGPGVGEGRRGVNMGLRGGFSGVGRRRGTGGSVVMPVKLKELDSEAVSYGAGGPGDGMTPPADGWVFDEKFLKQRGDWEEMLEKHL